MKLKRLISNALILLGFALSQSVVALAQQPSTGWTPPVDFTVQDVAKVRQWEVAVCDPYQNMHVFWAYNPENSTGGTIFYRNDASGNWSVSNDILISDPSIYYLATAVSARDNTIHLTWANNVGLSLLYYSFAPLTRAGDPRAWSTPQVLDENIFNPAIAADPNGNIHIVYSASDSTETNFDVLHIVTKDGGLTWSEPDIIFSTVYSQQSYIRVEMAIDGKGRIHVGLTQRSVAYGVFSEAGYVRSDDGGETWNPYVTIDDTSGTFQGIEWIAPYTFSDDEVHLTWHDPRRLHIQSTNGGKTWSTPEEIMALGAAFGGPNHLAKDSSNRLYAVIAWSDGVYVVGREDTGWGVPEQVDDRKIDPHGQHLVTCQGNQLNVYYYDRTGDTTVWYSNRQVDAPHISRKPIPAANPELTAKLTQEAAQVMVTEEPAVATATPARTFVAAGGNTSSPVPSPMRLVWMGIIPAAILIFAVVIFSFRRDRSKA